MRFIPFFLCWFSLSLSLNVVAQDMTLSPATYNALNKIQEQLGAQQLTEAEAGLHELEEQLAPGFGLALVHQLHGQLHLMKEESELALQHFREALALRSEEHTSELQSRENLVCRLLLEKKKKKKNT